MKGQGVGNIYMQIEVLYLSHYWQANVMLEYGLEDAEGLLSKNLGNATKNLTQVEHDLDFLR